MVEVFIRVTAAIVSFVVIAAVAVSLSTLVMVL
jgi:hypothetical protein